MISEKLIRQAPVGNDLLRHMRRGMELLFQAHQYAQYFERNDWDFAVEISCLREAGLTNSDLRWLTCKGHVAHACEISLPGRDSRRFQPVGELTLTDRSCFVLTEAGVCEAIRRRDGSEQPIAVKSSMPAANGQIHRVQRIPVWDSERQQLRVGGLVVKEFKLPSSNQTTVLSAFEEEHWPPRIDDPLPPTSDVSIRRRLHDTIRSLNRNQKARLIRFMGDGSGEGIRWEFVLTSDRDTTIKDVN